MPEGKSPATIGRDEDGKLLPGFTANPKGNNGHLRGWQNYGERALKLSEKYTTQQILEYAKDAEKRDADLSFWDATIIVHMARMIDRNLTMTDSGSDQVHKEREALLDRIEGKPTQTTELKTAPGEDGFRVQVSFVDPKK